MAGPENEEFLLNAISIRKWFAFTWKFRWFCLHLSIALWNCFISSLCVTIFSHYIIHYISQVLQRNRANKMLWHLILCVNIDLDNRMPRCLVNIISRCVWNQYTWISKLRKVNWPLKLWWASFHLLRTWITEKGREGSASLPNYLSEVTQVSLTHCNPKTVAHLIQVGPLSMGSY